MDVSGVVICPEISGPTSGGATMAPEVDVASLIASPQYKWLRDDVVKISNSGLSAASIQERLDTLFTSMRSEEQGGITPAAVLEDLRETGTRQMCQYQFRKNDIVWICKTCQRDETCVLCNACFPFSSHDGHEVYFYHSQAGGCCDCGDPEAWSPEGFCKRHGNKSENPLVTLPETIKRGGGVVLETVAQFIEFYATSHAETFEVYNQPLVGDEANHDDHRALILYYDDIHPYDQFQALFRLRVPSLSSEDTKAMLTTLVKEGYVTFIPQASIYRIVEFLDDAESDECDPRSFAWSVVHSYAEGAGGSEGATDSFVYQHDKGVDTFLGCLEWLTKLTSISDGICRLLSASFPVERLCNIIKADARLNPKCIRALHTFFLSLMADISFKRSVAIAYATCLPEIVTDFSNGVGTADLSIFRISVQFLNKPLIVDEIIKSHQLLESYAGAFLEIFKRPQDEAMHQSEDVYEQSEYALKHFVIRCKKYECIIGDLKVIFILPGVPKLYCALSLDKTLDGIRMFQYTNPQVRCLHDHIGDENENWIKGFNLELTLATFSDYLLSWFGDEDPLPANDLLSLKTEDSLEGVQRFCSLINTPDRYSILSPLVMITKKICEWHSSFPRSDTTLAPAFSAKFGFSFIEVLPDLSFHIMLHRLLAHCIRECCRFPEATNALSALHCVLAPNSALFHESPLLYNAENPDQISEYYSKLWWFYSLVDYPMNCLVGSAQIRAKLWVKNGMAMSDQNLNYSEYPFCNFFRDMDILLTQYLGVVCGSRLLLNFILCRFDVYLLLSTKRFGATHSDPAKNRQMIDEALNLIINLVTELPLPPVVPLPPNSKLADLEDGTNADSPGRIRLQLRREVLHRMMVGTTTYSQLYELRSLFRSEDRICEEVIDDIVEEVGVVQKGDRIEDAVKIFLKPQYWSEYDPGFYHFGVQHHQHVVGNRPKVKTAAPACPAPPIAHPTFLPLRHGLLVEPALLSYVRDFLYSFVSQRFEKYLDRRQTEGSGFAARAPEAPVWATSGASSCSDSAVTENAPTEMRSQSPRSSLRPNFLGDPDSLGRIPYFVSASIASKSWAIQCTDATLFKSIHILTLLIHHVEEFKSENGSEIPEYMRRNFETVAEYMMFCPHIMVSPPLAAFVDHLVQYPDNNSSPDVASMLQQHITAASSGMTTPYFTSGLGSMIASTVNSSRNSRAQSFDDNMSVTDYSIPSHESGINTSFTPLYSSMGTTGILSDRFVSVNTSELPMPLPEANNAGVALSMPSLVHVILMAYNMLHGDEDIEHRCHIRWLLDKIRNLFPTCGKLISEWMKEELDNERAEKLKHLQATAKERATAKIQAFAQNFMKSEEYLKLTAGRISSGPSVDINTDKTATEGVVGEKRGAADDEDETEVSGDACIICGCEGVRAGAHTTEGALGYLVLCQEVRQRSVSDSEPEMHFTIGGAKSGIPGATEYPAKSEKTDAASMETSVDHGVHGVEKNMSSNLRMHFRFCGHAMHFSCFDSFIPQVIAQSLAQQNLIVDINIGEFQCPLCKNVNNALVPAVCVDAANMEQDLNLDGISLVEASADRRVKMQKLDNGSFPSDTTINSSDKAISSSSSLTDWIVQRQKRAPRAESHVSQMENCTATPTIVASETRAPAAPGMGSSGWLNRAITALDAINSIIQRSSGQIDEVSVESGSVDSPVAMTSSLSESAPWYEFSEEAARVRNYWMRYLTGIVIPFADYSGSSVTGSEFFDSVARVLNSISFTISVECSENAPGAHVTSRSRGMDNSKAVAHVLDSLCLSVGAFGASRILDSTPLILGSPIDAFALSGATTVALSAEYAQMVKNCMANLKPGSDMCAMRLKIRCATQTLASLERLSRVKSSIGANLFLPLLARPIADVLVQSIGYHRLQESIIAAKSVYVADSRAMSKDDALRESDEEFMGGFKWLIIARLVQLVLTFRIESMIRAPKKPQKISFSDQKLKSEGLAPSMSFLVGSIDGVVTSFLCGNWTKCGSAQTIKVDALALEDMSRILFEWIVFIRDAVHALTRCGMHTSSSSAARFATSSGGIFNPDHLTGIIRTLSEFRVITPDNLTNQLIEAHLAAVDLSSLVDRQGLHDSTISAVGLEETFDNLEHAIARGSNISPVTLIRYQTVKWLRALYPEGISPVALAHSRHSVSWTEVKAPLRRALERGDIHKYIDGTDSSRGAAFDDPLDALLADVLNDRRSVHYFGTEDVGTSQPYMLASAALAGDGSLRDDPCFASNASTLGVLLGVLRRVDIDSKKTTRPNQLVPFLRHRIMPFPESYTKFHHFVRALCDFEYPAVCVSCGLIMDAGGKGLCTAHVSECTGASGAFFLLQDCQMLFMYHRRASYMPAPFVDDHGEKHKHFRGKPLHLDPQKYELLRSLIATCGIPSAVVHKRSISQRVIVENHY